MERFQTASNNGGSLVPEGMDSGLLSRGGLPRLGTGVSGQRSAAKGFTTINGPSAGNADGSKGKGFIK